MGQFGNQPDFATNDIKEIATVTNNIDQTTFLNGSIIYIGDNTTLGSDGCMVVIPAGVIQSICNDGDQDLLFINGRPWPWSRVAGALPTLALYAAGRSTGLVVDAIIVLYKNPNPAQRERPKTSCRRRCASASSRREHGHGLVGRCSRNSSSRGV